MYMKDRIAQIIQSEGLTAAQFAEKIGISAPSLSHILSGRNKPSLDVVMKIHKSLDYININWLLYGEGDMEADVDDDNNPRMTGLEMDENGEFLPEGQVADEYRKDLPSQSAPFAPKEIVREEVKYIEKPSRKISEIRIFFDDGTFETFRPEK